ncbi:uncharacterized protein LOC125227749 [Leguminivora glycinivorella]|uniref:uncharacterized protein LOC125227749 n=1 Tax=Leguminivora glycinivorella TaxID=1035111 RepID=UPI00200F11BF|nr:uncharacterized protein LOC125227749 [Leguminivora glycinivorella]
MHALAFATLLAAAAAAPATYDQRQDGDFNVRADVQNVVLVIAYPDKMKLPITDIFAGGLKTNKHDEFQERADVRVMEAFVEPSTPYRVDIGSDSERYADTDGRNVVVEIAGRRRFEAEPQETESDKEEYKLLGAQEQCGPDRERDPVTLVCRAIAPAAPEPAVPQPEPALQPEPAPQPEAPAAPTEPAVVLISS